MVHNVSFQLGMAIVRDPYRLIDALVDAGVVEEVNGTRRYFSVVQPHKHGPWEVRRPIRSTSLNGSRSSAWGVLSIAGCPT